jgi:ApbE superfamily uncharacterized protein (UPF0280 family)
MYKERAYRNWVKAEDLVPFRVIEKETDLLVLAGKDLAPQARAAVLNYRNDIEDYIRIDKSFYTSLEPVDIIEGSSAAIVRAMAAAARKAKVGPMAAVAGAMAEFVGRDLARFSAEVIVENGGDIFLKTTRPRALGIYAGESSPFTGSLAIELDASPDGIGACTSSGTVSHSLSFGRADAALVIAADAALADAAATAAGNAVKSPVDIEKGIAVARSIEGVRGALIIVGDKLGSWGEIKLV